MRKKDRSPIHRTARRISKADLTTIRRLGRESQVAALREGRKIRAATFADRRKQADKRACRGRVEYSR
jgi:hypothetical protein